MNIGKKWTSEEEDRLVHYLKNKILKREIAYAHGRTIGSISSRIRHMVIRMIEKDGKSTEEICDIMSIKPSDVIRIMKYNESRSTSGKTEIRCYYMYKVLMISGGLGIFVILFRGV